jgi:hypothetical protein
MKNARPRDSSRKIFTKLEIMTLYSQYIYSLLLYTVNNKHLFNLNNEIHKYNTRLHSNLHVPIVNITTFHKGAYISGIKVFIHLPQVIKKLANNEKSFKLILKRFLYQHPFYSISKYFEYKDDTDCNPDTFYMIFNVYFITLFYLLSYLVYLKGIHLIVLRYSTDGLL